VDRDEYYNAFKCQKKALELSKEFASSDHEICGICMAVCPLGKKKTS
jgi:epoxyqueuosine reductase QueG